MQSYDRSKPLVSIHIPKCAGTSFFETLSVWFGDKLYRHYFDERTNTMPQNYSDILSAGSCVHGHFNRMRNFGLEDYYPELNQRITILRDPFDILISRFFYQKDHEARGVLYRNGAKMEMCDDINEFSEKVIFIPDYRPNILHFLPNGITRHNYKDFLNEKFVYIGIAEDMTGTVNRIAEKLDKPQVPVAHVNSSERYAEVDERLRDKFRSLNEFVYLIYNYVKEQYLIW
jgi:hypothetical protein